MIDGIALLAKIFSQKEPEPDNALDFGNLNVQLAKENGYMMMDICDLNKRIAQLEEENKKLKAGNLI